MVFLLTIVRVALQALGRNKMRSILTMLGIIIGVGAVIAMVSIGQGAQYTISGADRQRRQQHALRMAGFRSIRAASRSGRGHPATLQLKTTRRSRASAPPCVSHPLFVRASSSVVFRQPELVYQHSGREHPLSGDTPLGGRERRVLHAAGRVVSTPGVPSGKTVVDKPLRGQDPVGQEIRIKNAPWQVIGVLKSKGQSGMGQDQDDTIIAPYTTVQKKIQGITFINAIMVSAVSESATATAQQQMTDLLRQRHSYPAGGGERFHGAQPVRHGRTLPTAPNQI